MKTPKEFRKFTVDIKTSMELFSITGIRCSTGVLRSDIGNERASDVFLLVSSNLREGALVNRERTLVLRMQSKELRSAIRQQYLRNLDKFKSTVRIHHPECDF